MHSKERSFKYYLIRFVLDQAYEDHKQKKDHEWEAWFQSLQKIFRGEIPEALLLGLRRKSVDSEPALIKLCDDYVRQLDQKRRQKAIDEERQQEIQEMRKREWIYKRDAGNQRAFQEFCKQREQDRALARKQSQELLEAYIQKTREDWQKTLDEYKEQRIRETTPA